MSFASGCQICINSLGTSSYNPTRQLTQECLGELETYCISTHDHNCSDCLGLDLGEIVPTPCFHGLERLYNQQCEMSTTQKTIATNHPGLNNGETKPSDTSVGTVPIILFILALVVVIVLICRKILESQRKKVHPEDILLEYAADTQHYPQNGHHQRGYHAPQHYSTSQHGSSSGSSRSLRKPSPHVIGEPYRHDSESFSVSRHSGQAPQLYNNRHYAVPQQHHQYPAPEERLLDAQDTLRANGRNTQRHQGGHRKQLAGVRECNPRESPGTPNTPSSRERGDSTTGRQTRINTLLNQNASSTSTIYGGALLATSMPHEDSCSKQAISESGEQTYRYSDRSFETTPERMVDDHRYERDQERERPGSSGSSVHEKLPLKERIKLYKFSSNSHTMMGGDDAHSMHSMGGDDAHSIFTSEDFGGSKSILAPPTTKKRERDLSWRRTRNEESRSF